MAKNGLHLCLCPAPPLQSFMSMTNAFSKKKKTTDVNICIHINICKLHHERHYFQGKVQAEVSANFLKIQVGSPSIIFNMLKRPEQHSHSIQWLLSKQK